VVGDLYPEAFSFWTLWRDRSAEDISVGGGRTEEHFKALLKKAFKEVRRVITDDGVFVVYFAHSRREAWAALLEAAMEAGFAATDVVQIAAHSPTDIQGQGKTSILSIAVFIFKPRTRGAAGHVGRLKPRLEAEVRKTLERLWREGYGRADLKAVAYAIAVKYATQFDGTTGGVYGELLSYAERVAEDVVARLPPRRRIEAGRF